MARYELTALTPQRPRFPGLAHEVVDCRPVDVWTAVQRFCARLVEEGRIVHLSDLRIEVRPGLRRQSSSRFTFEPHSSFPQEQS